MSILINVVAENDAPSFDLYFPEGLPSPPTQSKIINALKGIGVSGVTKTGSTLTCIMVMGKVVNKDNIGYALASIGFQLSEPKSVN